MFTFFRKPFRQCYIHQGIQTGLQETLGVREDTTKNKKKCRAYTLHSMYTVANTYRGNSELKWFRKLCREETSCTISNEQLWRDSVYADLNLYRAVQQRPMKPFSLFSGRTLLMGSSLAPVSLSLVRLHNSFSICGILRYFYEINYDFENSPYKEVPKSETVSYTQIGKLAINKLN